VHTYRTAIECKFEADPIGKDPITKLAYILSDAGIDKGVVVSKAGFTEDAKNVARDANISLVELRSPADKDWEGRLETIHIEWQVHVPRTTVRAIQPDGYAGNALREVIRREAGDILVHRPNLPDVTMDAIIGPLVAEAKNHDAGKEHELMFPPGSSVQAVGHEKSAPILGVALKVEWIPVLTDHQVIRGRDYVALVMHLVFEKHSFAILKDGTITGPSQHA
jgi:hypothetical protein